MCSGDFVPVKPHMDKYIQYTGDFKPSVDAPIQIKLFDYYKNVKYMIHGHAYVLRAFITEHKIPCGFIEEFDDITSIIPDPNTANFCINLRGHGCLILANDIEYLHSQLDNLVARPFPEQ